MPEKLPPFTPEELERAIRRSASRSLKRLAPLIADEPGRTPRGLRTPYRPDAWAALTPEARIAHARQILKAQAFDELVSARGVTLGDGVVA
ncbi:hypothetical protein ACIQF8_03155 [Pseudarthrobacter sp. NPDC092184]|uniref:hypothetical protein n=1 Tax=unclassified Pseudarthrobacter TaxID=2647000 RepID=UPI0038048E40